MKKTIKTTLFLSTLIFFFALHCRGVGEFTFALSQGDEKALSYLIELGIKWARVNISWKEVMPELKDPLLSLKQVKTHPEPVEGLSHKTDWSKIDHKQNRNNPKPKGKEKRNEKEMFARINFSGTFYLFFCFS